MSLIPIKAFLGIKYGRLAVVAWFWSTYYRLILLLNPACTLAGHTRITGRMHWDVDPRARVEIGVKVRINSGPLFNAVGGHGRAIIAVHRDALLRIGEGSGLSNCTVVCQQEVIIGRDVFIGGGVFIVDSDLHAIRPADRTPHRADKVARAAVRIEDEVFIGAHATILKGVTVGRGAVVGAGSVVAKNIPAGEIWAGNPARRIGHTNSGQ
jgi:acetyltransferase-like isoleucine patch superfamily enzyme